MKRTATYRRAIIVAATAAAVFAVDIISKTWALSHAPTDPRPLVGFLNLQLDLNPGNILNPTAAPGPFVVGSHVAMLIVLVGFFWIFTTKVGALAVGLALGGTIGNGIQLLLAPHHVVDFIGIGTWRVLNLADFALFAAALLAAWETVLFVRRLHRTPASSAASGLGSPTSG